MHTLGTPPSAASNVLVLDQSKKLTEQPAVTETRPSVRTVARKAGIDLGQLLNILSYRRPAGDPVEEQFVEAFLDPIEGMQKDEFGNRFIRVGTAPVMWSCHTDTVSDEGGMQNIKWLGDTLALNEPKRGQSLGADDGAGMWLMLEMLKAGKEGLYVFHREEEVGGLGSRWLAKNNPDLVKGIEMAIAFDRRATHSVITRQRGRRCCSDKFGKALANELSKTEGLDYDIDAGGVFTDTANYTDLIAECTNLSVGYYDEHGEDETLDVAHLLRLREAMLTIDVSTLPIERKAGEDDYSGYGYGGYGRSRSWSSNNWGTTSRSLDPLDRMHELVKTRGYTIAKILHNMGLTPFMLEQMISNVWQREGSHSYPSTGTVTKTREDDEKEWQGALADYHRSRGLNDDADLADEDDFEVDYQDMLFCNDCQEFDTTNTSFGAPQDGDFCGNCYRNNTEVLEVEVDARTGEIVQ